MTLPHASPSFAQAYAIARALSFPGIHVHEDGLPSPSPANLLDVRIAQLAMQIMEWPGEKSLAKLDQAKAEFLAQRTDEVKKIREGLQLRREPKPVVSKIDSELLGKIKISL